MIGLLPENWRIMTDISGFDIITDEEFEFALSNIIGNTAKNNTYKLALARFLLEYSHYNDKTHVDFPVIARYFLKYYWNQVCKLEMQHSINADQKPLIVKIIEKEFVKKYYAQTFDEICEKEPARIQRCVDEITKSCFHHVVWRFQRIKVDSPTEVKLFFDYKIKKTNNHNSKYVDLEYGLDLNPQAIKFLRQYNKIYLKITILEWARFLQRVNVKIPKTFSRTEDKIRARGIITKYKHLLDPFFNKCFYCKKQLSDGKNTHVEHALPFENVEQDDIWDLKLVCNTCNMEKIMVNEKSLALQDSKIKSSHNDDFKDTHIGNTVHSLNPNNQTVHDVLREPKKGRQPDHKDTPTDKRICNGLCKKFKVTKPTGRGRYAQGQGRCQRCDVWLDHNHVHLKDGSSAKPGSSGWFCNCCNYRVRQKPRNKKYKEKLREHKSKNHAITEDNRFSLL